MSKLIKKILVTGASLLVMSSVGAEVGNIHNANAAKLSSFPPSVIRLVKLTRTLKADKLYGSGYTQKRANHHTKFYRGEKAKVDYSGAAGYGFDIRNRKHPAINYVGYSLPIKDAKYFKIITNHHKRFHHKLIKKYSKRHYYHGKKYDGITYLRLIQAADSISNDNTRSIADGINFNGDKAKPFDIIDQPFNDPSFSIRKTITRTWHDLYHQLHKQGTTHDQPITLTFIYKPTSGRHKNKMYKMYTVKTNKPTLHNNHMKLIHSHKYNGYD